MQYEFTKSFAQQLDQQDPLRAYRDEFYFPQHNGKDTIYFCGNSLGLQPKAMEAALKHELDHWKTHGVEGHFNGEMPWIYYHKYLAKQSANLVGAKESEVVVMNTLTVNLHLMLVSFYRPTKSRYKIIMEGGAFPSDQYAVESQIRFHGFDPEDAIVEVHPRPGEGHIRDEDILEKIKEVGDELALSMFSGIQYYSGQFFDMKSITAAAHQVGAYAGFDLAHAAGNMLLELHDWGVDFAAWCSYKYLNSGPGGPSGAFIHDRHSDNKDLPRFAGWWGHDEASRFQMKKGFIPMKGAAGWQLSNTQIFSMAAHKVTLDQFDKIGMPALRKKSEELTAYLYEGIQALNKKGHSYNIITPKEKHRRGAQLSILTDSNGKQLFDYLTENGVIGDWREPNVIRVAPAPMYNSFEDVWGFLDLLESSSS